VPKVPNFAPAMPTIPPVTEHDQVGAETTDQKVRGIFRIEVPIDRWLLKGTAQ
jgi:hypothetical protein